MENKLMTARGEMSMDQPSGDRLKGVLAGDWKLSGDVPGGVAPYYLAGVQTPGWRNFGGRYD
jgi:hypothetical protein